jgi:nucleotide-binding universal stress UspA family protein
MDPKKILVPIDFSTHAARALDYAVVLAKPFGASVHLLHVIAPPAMPAVGEMPVLPVSFWEEMHKNAVQRLDGDKRKVEAAGVRCTTEVIEDFPGFAISACATRVGADLIVMGSRGLTGVKHLVLGSVAERTVRAALCPVLTVKDAAPGARLKTIVVPMDFSPSAHAALDLAKSLATRVGPAHLILVHAYFIPIELQQYLAGRGEALFDKLSESAAKDLELQLVELQKLGISSEYVSKPGHPELVIGGVATEKHADMIVMGTHGRRGLSHLLLGSVAEIVVRSAPCAVLTVRGTEKKPAA